MSVESSVNKAYLTRANLRWHSLRLPSRQERIEPSMTKTLDHILDVIRNSKHPFRQVDDRPAKSQKHRYERRKIKEYIKLGDWVSEMKI